MAIGIIDQDALLYPNHFNYNLEVMKFSAYYKSQKQIVRLLLDARLTDQYSKVILRKNKIDANYPDTLMCKSNIEFGGLAFTKNKYKALPPEIENILPDKTIYDEFLTKVKKSSKIVYERNSSHLRLSTNGIDCDVDYNKFISTQNITLHDVDICSLNGSYEILKDLTLGGHRIFCLNKAIVPKMEIENWVTNVKFADSNVLLLKDRVNNYEFKNLIDLSKKIDFHMGDMIIESQAAFLDELELWIRRILYIKSKSRTNKVFTSSNTPLKYRHYFNALNSWSINKTVSLSSTFSKKTKEEFDILIARRPHLKGIVEADPLLIRKKGGIILV